MLTYDPSVALVPIVYINRHNKTYSSLGVAHLVGLFRGPSACRPLTMRSHSASLELPRKHCLRNNSQHVESNMTTCVLHAVDLSDAVNDVDQSLSEFRPEDNTNDESDATPTIADGESPMPPNHLSGTEHTESEAAHPRGNSFRMPAPSDLAARATLLRSVLSAPKGWELSQNGRYKHSVTGIIRSIKPTPWLVPGPAREDMLQGWKAELTSLDDWEYEHCATGIKTYMPPASLETAALREIETVTVHGKLPEYCTARAHENGRISYRLLYGDFETYHHPKIFEERLLSILATLESQSQSRSCPKVELLTSSGTRSLNTHTINHVDFSNAGDVLFMTHVDLIWIRKLRSLPGLCRLPVVQLIACHLLHEQALEEDVTVELLGYIKSSYREPPVRVWDAMYDDHTRLLKVWDSTWRQLPSKGKVGRVSFVGMRYENLIRKLQYMICSDCHLILTTTAWILVSPVDLASADSVDPLAAPIAFLPTYLHSSSGVQEDFETHLARFTRLALEGMLSHKISFMDEYLLRLVENHFFKIILTLSAWQDGLQHLSSELAMLLDETAQQPHDRTFMKVNKCRRHAQSAHNDMYQWVGPSLSAEHGQPDLEWVKRVYGRTTIEEFERLRNWASDLRQEFRDVSKVLDSRVQQELVRDSREQARRATELTVLAAIYLPLSLTTGVFGMNIWEINEGKPKWWAVFAFGLALLCITGPILFWVLRKNDQDQSAHVNGKTERPGGKVKIDEKEGRNNIHKPTAQPGQMDRSKKSKRLHQRGLAMLRRTWGRPREDEQGGRQRTAGASV